VTDTLPSTQSLDPLADQPELHVVRKGPRRPRYGTHLFLIAMSVLWLAPLLWTIYTSLRSRSEVNTHPHTYFSFTTDLTLQNYSTAWTRAGFETAFTNSAIIVIPCVLLTLFLASIMAFAVSRFSWKFNITLLILFTAGNMLPPQVLAAPIFEMYKHFTLPYSVSDSGNLLNTYYGVIAIIIAFQLGFCTFVLSNYMKALPTDLTEAALVDGCGVWRMYRQIILPLCRPALAALGTLEVIWVYNEFFWPLLLIQSGDRLPVTTAINSLKGQFLSDYNLIAAGATITLVPTLIIYLALQRQFVAGLTLGGSKG
jgi:multiple sugar transport system permease protein